MLDILSCMLMRHFQIKQFLQKHINYVGEKQAIKDLQTGLSLLNKKRRQSPLPWKNILKEDGVFGPKTQTCLLDACKNYTPRVIRKYILKGIQNNVIFDTKNNGLINTRELIQDILSNLEQGGK